MVPKNKNKFLLKTKIIIGTFGTDYLEQINCKYILESYKNKKLSWDFLIVKSHGDKEIKHDHFHFIGFWTGKDRATIKSDKYFDIEIDKPLYSFEDNEGNKHYELKENINNEDLKNLLNKYSKFITLTVAHPNFKGKDNKKYGSEYDMLKYVWDQKIEYESTFDVQLKLDELYLEKQKNLKKQSKVKEIKIKLANYVREQWLAGAPKQEVVDHILKDEELSSVYLYNTAIQHFIEKQFNKTKPFQPSPIFGIYYVPKGVADYLDYLNDFTKSYYEEVIIPCKQKKYDKYETAMEAFVQKHKNRGKCLIFKGKGGIGKTHLFACYGPCSYWKDRFNFDQWNNWGFFNWFDDVDVYSKKQNNDNKITADDWEFLKTWIGGQYQSSFSGKYRAVKTVINYKPCIFTTNKDIDERFNNEALTYMKELETVTIEYCNEKLFEPKKTNTIGGFAKWRKIDTRETYYYKNIYLKQKRKSEEISNNTIPELINNKKPKTVLEHEEETPILIEDKSADITINNDDLFDPPQANIFASNKNNKTNNNNNNIFYKFLNNIDNNNKLNVNINNN